MHRKLILNTLSWQSRNNKTEIIGCITVHLLGSASECNPWAPPSKAHTMKIQTIQSDFPSHVRFDPWLLIRLPIKPRLYIQNRLGWNRSLRIERERGQKNLNAGTDGSATSFHKCIGGTSPDIPGVGLEMVGLEMVCLELVSNLWKTEKTPTLTDL